MDDTFMADFESTTTEENCHVWAWAVCEVGDPDNLWIGTDIYDFMDWCETRPENVKVWFHNLKWDSQFIISWCFQNDFVYAEKPEDRATKTFRAAISDKGLYYTLEVIFWLKGKNVKKVTFFDSSKLFPNMGVDDVAKAFHMPISKLKIDYTAHDNLPYGSPLTPEEKEYIINDVQIMANALYQFKAQGLDKITIGSNALAEYKKLIGDRTFKRWFPRLKYHDELAQGYKGGVCMLGPGVMDQTIGRGLVLDKNSMHPWVMKEKPLPYGTPIYYRGEYTPDPLYPLYTQMIRCSFKIKKGKLPTIQLKHSDYYSGNEYVTDSHDEEITMVLNSVDLQLFMEHYEPLNLEYIGGWKFMAQVGMFDAYIDKWTGIKIQAETEGNFGLRLIAKTMLNSLYGKFGTSTTRKSKHPEMGDDGKVKYIDADPVAQEGVYVPVASFITSYAREETLRSAQRIIDDYNAGKSKIRFLYMDTDSLHIATDDFAIPEGLDIDKYRLGAWKMESKFEKAKFLRAKCYIENEIISEEEYTEGIEGEEKFLYTQEQDGFRKLKITVAGMPSECYPLVNFQNFKVNAEYQGKKQQKIVPGGVILTSIDFTIKR